MDNQKEQSKKARILILLFAVIISSLLLAIPFIVSAMMDSFPAPIGVYILGLINSLIVLVLAILLIKYGQKLLKITSKEGGNKIFKIASTSIGVVFICLAFLFLGFFLFFGYLNIMNYS